MQREVTPTLRVRKSSLKARVDKLGLESRSAEARHVGLSKWTLIRLLAGSADTPGGSVIARMLVAFPDADFDELFEVVDERTGRRISRSLKAAS